MSLDQLLFKAAHSLIDQSLHSRLGRTTTNGDGFGIGWYGVADTPGLFHRTEPAWDDRNLKELACHLVSRVVLAHVRASTAGAIQQTNCHPFRHGRWLWMHNGGIAEFVLVKRDLAFAVDPSLYPAIQGSTDSELFFLALTFGLEQDAPWAVERAVGLVGQVGHRHGVEHPIQLTVATTNGASTWVFRYSSEHHSPSLFFSTAVETLRDLYPDIPILSSVSDESRLVVPESVGNLAGGWNEVPESSWVVAQAGPDELHAFRPRWA